MTVRGEFIDEATVFVFGGDGGNGVVSFQREKYRPKGGPDGGNGGNGGSVIFRADPNIATLVDLARAPHRRAPRGAHGSGDDRHGANASDLIVLVPEGTVVTDATSGELIADLEHAQAEAIVARGGAGGRGNASLATNRRRAPAFAERGEEGEQKTLHVELRVLADVGLVGLPNAGKSSLIARLSAARPKVAAYPFTTLSPHLGVAYAGDERFVIADVPGLIEGAASGKGLGHDFLKHLQRCRVLCFVIDASSDDPDPLKALESLRAELQEYSASLIAKPFVIAANKSDLPTFQEIPNAIAVSALDGSGIEELHEALSDALAKSSEISAEEQHTVIRITPEQTRVVIEREGDSFRVISPIAERLVSRFDLENEEAVAYLQERFVSLGIEDALAKAGAVEGDDVKIGDASFEFLPERAM
ncbi:MAG: GTPase ObgE [Actinomycetota bacterium]